MAGGATPRRAFRTPEERLRDLVDAVDDGEGLIPVLQEPEDALVAEQFVDVVEVTPASRFRLQTVVGDESERKLVNVNELLEERPRWMENRYFEWSEVLVLLETGPRCGQRIPER